MPVRPKNTGGGNFTGYKKAAISKIVDRSGEVDQLDVVLDFELKVEGSEYEQTCSIAGSFEYDEEGNITENSFLKRIYRIFDGIGEQGGVDIKGRWVDKDDEPLDDIVAYLSKYINTDKYPYIVYIYKQKGKDGKLYNRVYPMIVPNTSQGNEDIHGYINFMLKKGYLIEHNEEEPSKPIVEGAPTSAFKNQF